MKRTVCLLLALFLTGCAAGVPEETPSETPTPTEEVAESAPPEEPLLPENAAEGTVVEFTKDLPATVDEGRTLTLRLHCRAVASGYGTWDYGVNVIDVLEGEKTLQILSVLDAMEAAVLQRWEQWAAEGDPYFQEQLTAGKKIDLSYSGGWTCYSGALYPPDIGDLNFDSSDDIRLMEEDLHTANKSYLCWLWDQSAGRFQYAFSLYGYELQIDEEGRQLIVKSHFGWYISNTDYYQYDENGVLRRVKNVELSLPNGENAQDEDCITTVHEWVNGVWTQTEQTTSKMQG